MALQRRGLRKCEFFSTFPVKKVFHLLSIQKLVVPLHSQTRNNGSENFWCGSSAWLEYMPVTHGVAGSSPVRTAKSSKILGLFFYLYHNRKNPQASPLICKSSTHTDLKYMRTAAKLTTYGPKFRQSGQNLNHHCHILLNISNFILKIQANSLSIQ